MSRHKVDINWELVEKRMEAGCTGREIAACLRVCEDTFSDRFREQYGKYFSEISGNFYKAGDANIKYTQYMRALGGNNNMLLLLGRERLGQGKEEESKSPYEDVLMLRHENMILKAEIEKMKGENAEITGNMPSNVT